MLHKVTITAICLALLVSCNNNSFEYDASGTFEATEIIVSPQTTGQLIYFDVVEGQKLEKDIQIGLIDTVQLYLQKMQLVSSQRAIKANTPNIRVQTASIKEQISKAEFERQRLTNLMKDNAATQKQIDDINSQIKVLQNTLAAQQNVLNISSQGIHAQSSTVDVQIAIINELIRRSVIVNPISGTVLAKYSQASEMVTPVKPLYKIADTHNLFLRAYVIASQLSDVKIGQTTDVIVSYGDNSTTYKGTVSWISDKAEFSPKTIQTKDERQNLVYAVKIAVENTDGLIKLGMYGDVNFK